MSFFLRGRLRRTFLNSGPAGGPAGEVRFIGKSQQLLLERLESVTKTQEGQKRKN